LGDITGHGLTAALMMSNLQALFRMESRRASDVGEVLTTLNNCFYENTESHHFATFAYGVYDPATRNGQIASAGHDPFILVRHDNRLVDGPTGGVLLGLLPDQSYVSSPFELQPGDLLCIYSDGITESENAQNRQFERSGLTTVLQESRGQSASAIVDHVLAAARDHRQGVSPNDDQTVVILTCY